MLRLVPPAGAPLRVSQILRALVGVAKANGPCDNGLAALATRLHVRHVLSASSGRAALWVILRALYQLGPGRDIVAIPAYTCFSIPASIARAGLRVHPVDINPETMDFDFSLLAEVPADKLLCVIASSLFGLPNDMTQIRCLAQAKDAFVVDDAAQGLGAVFNGQLLGTTGDVGLYSLGRGKALTTLEGGIIVTNSDEIAKAIENVAVGLPHTSFIHDAGILIRMISYAVLLNPRLYWLPDTLPFLKLGVTDFDPHFRTSTLATLPRVLLMQLVDELDTINQTRRRNAHFLRSALTGSERFLIPHPLPESQGIYTRFPIVAADEATKRVAVRRLRESGIGASSFYPSAVCDIPGIGQFMARPEFHCPKAEDLSRRLFTVPTHPYVRMEDLETVVRIMGRL